MNRQYDSVEKIDVKIFGRVGGSLYLCVSQVAELVDATWYGNTEGDGKSPISGK
jgi:hypothetical protein